MSDPKIPKFTQSAKYKKNVAWRYLKETIERHQEDLNLQLNPDFQRGHVWIEKQQIEYVEFIMKGGSSGRDLYFNQAGWMTDWRGDFVCVDGLQRLTAVLHFLNNKFKVFNEFYASDWKRMTDDWEFTWYINNLKTKVEVLQWYLEMNSGGVLHTEDELWRVEQMLLYHKG